MPGKIKEMIDTIISQRTRDNPRMASVIRTKLILKGIDPGRYTSQSDDDPAIIAKLEAVIRGIR